jgi:hypothetical protein
MDDGWMDGWMDSVKNVWMCEYIDESMDGAIHV